MMSAGAMHADEVSTDEALVGRLLATQFPRWADLPLEPVDSAGTDNAMYRLGDGLAVRLPRIPWAIEQVDKEHRWLPALAPSLPLAIPSPVAMGVPGEGYPWRWSIYRWLEGEDATTGRLRDPLQAAIDLGRFVAAMHQIDPVGGPPPGEHNFFRGVPLAERDQETRDAIVSLRGMVDATALTAAWDAALRAPQWHEGGVWIHGDLQPGNLLIVDGQLNAVIDFGGLGVGDPACDLLPAWNLFDSSSRDAFREALDIDDAAWARGRGWALSIALIFIPYYLETNSVGVANARRVIEEVLADARSSAIG